MECKHYIDSAYRVDEQLILISGGAELVFKESDPWFVETNNKFLEQNWNRLYQLDKDNGYEQFSFNERWMCLFNPSTCDITKVETQKDESYTEEFVESIKDFVVEMRINLLLTGGNS